MNLNEPLINSNPRHCEQSETIQCFKISMSYELSRHYVARNDVINQIFLKQ